MSYSVNSKNHLKTLITAIAILTSTIILLAPEGVVSLDIHDPIRIIGNENFTSDNGVVGGSGKWDDPYVIAGWEIPISIDWGIYIENATAHFRIENVYIHGADSGPAIYFWQSSNGTIANSMLEDNFNSFFFWFTSNITVVNNNITNSRTGIRVANSSSVRVSHITFESCGRLLDLRGSSFVSIYDNTADWGGIFIDGTLKEQFNSHEIPTNNTVRGKPTKYVKDCYDLRLDGIDVAQVIVANCSGITLTNLSISGTDAALQLAFVRDGFVSSSYLLDNYFGIVESYSNNITYQDVVISNASEKAAWIRYSNDTTFSDCDIRFSYTGIRSLLSRNLTVRDSSFHSLVTGGVSSSQSSDILLKGNWFHKMMYGYKHWRGDNITILENGFRDVGVAIELWLANDSLVAGNLFVESGRALWTNWLHHSNVTQNVVINAGVNSFEIWGTTNTTFTKNRFDGASIHCLEIAYSENNTISENYIANCPVGIGAYESQNNRFFHNNIMNNTIQAFDRSVSDNEWDDGYPSGGNYWSNYTGPDNFSGPNQDIPGSDGIRDIPFDFDPDTSDDYPLMSPVIALPPDAPRDLTAELSGNGYENVTLFWNLSVDDVNGQKSVIRYDILRGTNYSSNLSGYILYDSVSKGSFQYTDIGGGEGDPNNYFYVVCAIDLNENSSCSRNQAAKFTCLLSRGPNLVSTPLVQSNESIEAVLQTVQYDKAWFYDSSSQEWKSYVKSKSYSTLNNVNHTMGVWINVTKNSNLTVAGMVPTQTAIHLYKGWNLVGFPSFNPTYSVSDLNAGVGPTRVEGFDPLPPYHLRVFEDSEVLQAGDGYWVRVEADVAWMIDIQ